MTYKKYLPLIILMSLALLTRFIFLTYPQEAVFDEVHFGKFVTAYFTGEYYFDIHPPLGKLMISGTAGALGFSNSENKADFQNIGEKIAKSTLFQMRFLPAFFGALLIPLVYLFSLSVGLSKKAAFLAGSLALFDNSLLTQSRFILVDVFLLVFGIASLYLFFLARKKESALAQYSFLILSAFFASLAFSVKWTGLLFWGLIMIMAAVEGLTSFNWKALLKKVVIFAAIPFMTYFVVNAIHLKALPKSGPGNAYMSSQFQKTLSGNTIPEDIKPLSLWQKFLESNKAMYNYNKNLAASHPYSSKWQEWPFGKKPVWYWTKESEQSKANIFLAGNPVIWGFVLMSVVFSAYSPFKRKWRRKLPPAIYLFLAGYIFNLLPFILIKRVTFLYHYLPSLVFGILIVAVVFDLMPSTNHLKKDAIKRKANFPKAKNAIFAVGLAVVIVSFLIFLPLTYGFPVSPEINKIYSIFLDFLG